MKKISKNKIAEEIVGLRDNEGMCISFPCELHYHCPVCKYEILKNGNYDERLEWSEYNGFIWCSVCDKDFPSVLCNPNIDSAIDIYLACISHAKLKNKL